MSTESTSQPTEPLFSDFSPHSYDDWRKAIDKALKGAPFEKKLVTKTYENIALQPIYRQEDIAELPHIGSLPGFAPYVRGAEWLGYAGKPWDVCQELPYGTPQAFNAALHADLERGQNAVSLVLDPATRAGQDADRADSIDVGQAGVSISSLADLGVALQGIDPAQTPIFLQPSPAALPLTALLAAWAQQQGQAPAQLKGAVGLDPLGELARAGSLPYALEQAYDLMSQLASWASANAPQLQTVAVQGHPYHDGGASATQELGLVLATAVEYLRALQARGLNIETAAPSIRFSLSLGSNIFMEIARLRAARLTWAKIVKAFGGSDEAGKMRLHVRTSGWNKTVYDPYVNMLRATTEAFSGVLGGCDSLYVAPFDAVVRPPDEFSRRIARNVHTILREESGLARTVDPGGGSWYIEYLTDAVAQESWKLFQEIERQGGMFAALQAGTPQQQISQVAAQRSVNIARRKDVFVGVNRYANLKEKPLEIKTPDLQGQHADRVAQITDYRAGVDQAARQSALDQLAASGDSKVDAAIKAAASGATLGDINQALGLASATPTSITPVCIQRGAVPFENLRATTDAHTARTGTRPQVFLANLGPLPKHKARADFSCGFLEVAAFDVIYGPGFDDPEQAAKAALDSGALAVTICGTDEAYPELAGPIAQRIKAVKPEVTVLLAGRPAEHIDALKAAGVDDFIYLGANCLEILSNLQKKMGVTA